MPGHRELGARSGRDTRSGFAASPKPLPVRASTSRDRRQDVVPQAVGQLLAGREVVVAGLGRDGEAGRDRQAGAGHLGEAGALAAEQVAHRRVALGRTGAPGVDVALGGAVGAIGPGCGRHVERAPSAWTRAAAWPQRSFVVPDDCTFGGDWARWDRPRSAPVAVRGRGRRDPPYTVHSAHPPPRTAGYHPQDSQQAEESRP